MLTKKEKFRNYLLLFFMRKVLEYDDIVMQGIIPDNLKTFLEILQH